MTRPFSKIRSRALGYNQVYITNDLANAWDVYNTVRNSQSVNRGVKRLLIYRISKKGELVRHEQLKYLSELNQKQISEFFTFWHDGKFKEASGYLESLTDFRASTTKRKQPSFNTAKRWRKASRSIKVPVKIHSPNQSFNLSSILTTTCYYWHFI